MWLPAPGTHICPLEALAEKPARSFILRGDTDAQQIDVIIWREGQEILGFVNQCPHLHLPLETMPDRLLNNAQTALLCSAHGAQFDRQGFCFIGPCKGDALKRLDVAVMDTRVDTTDGKPNEPDQPSVVLNGWFETP